MVLSGSPVDPSSIQQDRVEFGWRMPVTGSASCTLAKEPWEPSGRASSSQPRRETQPSVAISSGG